MIGRRVVTELHPYDVMITPVLTNPPRGFGYWDMSEPDIDKYNAKWTDGVFMFTFNVSGQPAMAVPMHMTDDGVPIGIQIVGRPCDEATLVRVAAQIEQARPWIDRKPPVCAA